MDRSAQVTDPCPVSRVPRSVSRISLPVSRIPSPESRIPRFYMPEGKILVVDDEERQREIYRDILQSEGYDAETAASGEAALKLLDQARFDLVITDLNLTGMNGLQLLSEIVVDDPTVAVIMITGYPSIQSAVEATRKGVYQYLEKPVDRDVLLQVVEEVFQRLATLKRTIIGDSPATKAMMR